MDQRLLSTSKRAEGPGERELYSQALYWRMRPSEKRLLAQAASASSWLTMSRIVRMSLCGGGKISLNTEFLSALKEMHRIAASVENLFTMTRYHLEELVDNPFLSEIRPQLHESLGGLDGYMDRLKIFRYNLVAVAEAAAAQMTESRTPSGSFSDRQISDSAKAYEALLRRQEHEYMISRGSVRITPSQSRLIWQMARREGQMSGRGICRSRLIRACVAGVIFLSFGSDLVGDILRLSRIISSAGDELMAINGLFRDLIDDPLLSIGSSGRNLVTDQLNRIGKAQGILSGAQDDLLDVITKLKNEIKDIKNGNF